MNDKKKQIEDLEKQIAELRQVLEDKEVVFNNLLEMLDDDNEEDDSD